MNSSIQDVARIPSDVASHATSLRTQREPPAGVQQCRNPSKARPSASTTSDAQITAANLSTLMSQLAHDSSEHRVEDANGILTAGRDLGFGEVAERIAGEQESIEASNGKQPMERWLEGRDERLVEASYRNSPTS